MTSFAQQVDAWTRQSVARMEAVFKSSAQDVIEVMDAGCPVDLGFLKNSREVRLNEPFVNLDQNANGTSGSPKPFVMVIVNAKLGDYITASYSAVYAPYVHFGAGNKPPRPWVFQAAMQWPQIVTANVAKAKAAVG